MKTHFLVVQQGWRQGVRRGAKTVNMRPRVPVQILCQGIIGLSGDGEKPLEYSTELVEVTCKNCLDTVWRQRYIAMTRLLREKIERKT